jgi:hypothetical protein
MGDASDECRRQSMLSRIRANSLIKKRGAVDTRQSNGARVTTL